MFLKIVSLSPTLFASSFAGFKDCKLLFLFEIIFWTVEDSLADGNVLTGQTVTAALMQMG